MLTQMKFKNWRSLRDVTIDFAPITVFIGANSSGKSNILDALHFLRRSILVGADVAVFNWQGFDQVKSIHASLDDEVILDSTYRHNSNLTIGHELILTEINNKLGTSVKWRDETGQEFNPRLAFTNQVYSSDNPSHAEELAGYFNNYRRFRWQLLRENMMPPKSLPSTSEFSDPYIIDPLAGNVPLILDFMKNQNPDIYQMLQDDLQLLLNHIKSLKTVRDQRETRIVITEESLRDHESPTISAGTLRIIAVLSAYYALQMPKKLEDVFASYTPSDPGLIAIEEPDTALHPLLLGNFVDLLRTYVDPEQNGGYPRQFILTTHNPMMLNYFQPEEVRVVERNPETGETQVHQVPDYLRETWLDEHQLGEAWTSRIIGGFPKV